MDLGIVTPIKKPEALDRWIEWNKPHLENNLFVAIDSGGGEKLRNIAFSYLKLDTNIWEARRVGYNVAYSFKLDLVLNLDSDVLIPKGYIEDAILEFEKDENLGAVSLFYDGELAKHRGTLEFGISMWRRELLARLYNYNEDQFNKEVIKYGPDRFAHTRYPYCECLYMWEKLLDSGYKLEALGYRAKHLREVKE